MSIVSTTWLMIQIGNEAVKPFVTREIRAITLLIVVLAISCVFWFIKRFHPTMFMGEPELIIDTNSKPSRSEIVVHVVGEVNQPGLVHLPRGARTADAIRAAGGATPEADLELLNQAAVLVDGRQVRLPAKHIKATDQNSNGLPDRSFPIPLNTITQSELERIPGIGPVTAKRILEYRATHAGFSSIEELLNVRGIGTKSLERFQEYLVVY